MNSSMSEDLKKQNDAILQLMQDSYQKKAAKYSERFEKAADEGEVSVPDSLLHISGLEFWLTTVGQLYAKFVMSRDSEEYDRIHVPVSDDTDIVFYFSQNGEFVEIDVMRKGV